MRIPLTIRMLAPVIGVSIVLLGVGVVTAWNVQRLQHAAARILAHNVASIRATQEMEIGLRKVRARINTFRLTGERSHLNEIPSLRTKCDTWLQQAVGLSSSEREHVLMECVQRGYERFFAECDRLISDTADLRSREEHWARLNDALSEEIVEPAHEFLEINAKLMAESSAQGNELADRMAISLLVLGTTGPVAGLLVGFSIARGVARSIVQLSVPIRDTEGKLTEVVGPITASAGVGFEDLESHLRKLAAHVGTVVERLQQSQREVLRAEQLAAVGQLAAGVAHELRNPLMSIKLLGQTAAKQGANACLRGKDIEVLNVATSRLEASLQSLLDFARPTKPEKRRFELRAVIGETLGLVAGRAARQTVQINCDAIEFPLWLVADIGQIRQLLLNLLINALDAVAPGGTIQVLVAARDVTDGSATVGADLHNSSQPQNWVAIRIVDSGCGIPTELGDRIFEPFVSSKDTGAGLGLTISKRIVEAHGGRLEARNRPEGGAEFTVRLPLINPEECT